MFDSPPYRHETHEQRSFPEYIQERNLPIWFVPANVREKADGIFSAIVN